MAENEMTEMTEIKITNPKPKILIIGGVIGALMGLGAAFLLIQRAEREHRTPSFSAAEGIKLGLVALGAMKQVAQLGGGEK
jgi:hypothetical protein